MLQAIHQIYNDLGKKSVSSILEDSMEKFSDGSALCYESLNDLDVGPYNSRLWERHINDVSTITWKKAKAFGIHGVEEDGVYVEKIQLLEIQYKECKRVREGKSLNCQ